LELAPADPHRRLTMAAPAFAVTIARAAEILGEDEELLWDLVDGMEPEDGCLWIHGTAGEETIAFTSRGLECLREMLADHKRSGLSLRS
jgi:hypothetical protein